MVTLLPWQVAQPLVMPAWLKAALAKLAPSTTGRVVLELPPTWQDSQPCDPMGMWLAGGRATGGTMCAVLKVAALAALWHCAQLVLLDGALAWMAAIDGICVKSSGLWQSSQRADEAIGIWLLATPILLKLKVEWHAPHDMPEPKALLCNASAGLVLILGLLPAWQVWQVLACTFTWLNLASSKRAKKAE